MAVATRPRIAAVLLRQVMRSRRVIIVGALVLAGSLSAAGWTVAWESDVRTMACHVSSVVDTPKDFDRWGKPHEFDRQVRTRKCGVLNMNADWLHSAATPVHAGASYRFTVVGWRSPIFDLTPNIIASTPAH